MVKIDSDLQKKFYSEVFLHAQSPLTGQEAAQSRRDNSGSDVDGLTLVTPAAAAVGGAVPCDVTAAFHHTPVDSSSQSLNGIPRPFTYVTLSSFITRPGR